MFKLSNHRVPALALLTAFTLSACAIGPDYARAPVDLPEQYPAAQNVDTQLPLAVKNVSAQWWQGFNDDVLNQMETQALAYNHDLEQANARVTEAAAQARIARNGLLPQVNASGTATRGQNAETIYGSNEVANAYQVGATLSWELDVWGKLRRTNESARAAYLASRYTRDALQLSLTAQVAQTYFQLRALDASLDMTRKTLVSREQSLKLQQARFNAGYLSQLEVSQAVAELASAKLSAEQLALSIKTTETALAVLLGQAPRTFTDANPRGLEVAQLLNQAQMPRELPANLLLRRADLASAEQQLIAANANIGVARAAYFPSVSLSASAGSQGITASQLFSGPAAAWSFVGNLAAPIFNFGTTGAQVKVANARQQQALAAYQKAIQVAFKEAFDASNTQISTQAQLSDAREQMNAAQKALKLVDLRYEAGYSGYFELLDAQRNAYATQLALINIQLAQLDAQVGLFKALGGGWVAD
jgi:multidrug efflux system outer membrane protein